MAVIALCCAAPATAENPQHDARLQEAQAAYEKAKTLYDAGKYAEAMAPAESALALREAVLGATHLAVSDSLSLLGRLHGVQRNFSQSGPLFQRALAIRETALGKDHPKLASVLGDLAYVYHAQQRYEQAEPLYLRALAIMEADLGKPRLTLAMVLTSLANLYETLRRYEQAEPLYQRALAIREAALGKHHPAVAKALISLAIFYTAQGGDGRAEPLYERALAIREAALGTHHPDVASVLNGLATLYSKQGSYGRAEPLYRRALAIREAALGKDHPDTAGSLTNLANLYKAQGLYSQVEPLYVRALAIQEAALGKDHFDVAHALNNLANLYTDQGLYGRAEPLYARALAIQEATFGRNHPDVADSLNNLASLYCHQRAFGRAEPLLERALTLKESAFGKHHLDITNELTNLALVYLHQGLYGRAGPLLERALAIREMTLGKRHPDVAQSLKSLALLQLAQRRLDLAVPLLSRAFAISEQRLRKEALDFSEARLASFLQLLRFNEEFLYTLLRAHPDDARVSRLALSAALLLKGRSLEETAGISRAIYRSLGPEERSTFESLRELRTRLAQLSLQGPGALPTTAHQRRLAELTAQGDALEALLAQRSAPLRALATLPSPAHIVGQVAAALPRNSALVEFIAYRDDPLLSQFLTSEPALRGQLRYLALVLLPDATIHIRDLGPAEPLELAASLLRDAMANRDASIQAHAQALYQLAFQPLLPLVGKTRRLYLSPDGQLALVPFAALHDGSQFLVETFDFTYLTSGRDLLTRRLEKGSSDAVIVLADPDFSAPLQAPAPSLAEASAQAGRSPSVEGFFHTLSADPAHRTWGSVPLPGTRQEAEAIQRLLPQAQLFLGPEATKERLLHLPAPAILHLATHGFFLEDGTALPRSRAIGHAGALGEAPLPSRPSDPLLRSGLLFAGASTPQPSPGNTLATALELAGLDLWGTQLVALSACDTGRGDVKRGQGVYGMRRAFVAAGAETVVMSLWKVNDETTRTLMEAYYRNLLAGQGRATALRAAMRSLRAAKPHPHYWAPFIALGRDTPLRWQKSNPRKPPLGPSRPARRSQPIKTRSVSTRSFASSSGCRSRVSTPLPIRSVVVRFPAASRSEHMLTTSRVVSFWPFSSSASR